MKVLKGILFWLINLPIKLYVLTLVFWLMILNRSIPDWLIKRFELELKPQEELPEPYTLQKKPF